MSTIEHIDRFIGYFKKQLELIDGIPKSDSSKIFRKALYVSVIDTLSKCVFPHRVGNRERFVAFVMRFSNWSEGYNVSMPHLEKLLRVNPDPAYEKLRKSIFAAYNGSLVHRSQIVGIDTDPTYEDIKKDWPVQKECRIPIEGVTLESLQHFNLLYAYRNSLVHELREPGYGMEFDEDEQYPYYHSRTIISGDGDERRIELVYPVNFFRKIASTCIDKLDTYLKDSQLDPYDYYKFGTYWIAELNE
jgi:hypothetical protein